MADRPRLLIYGWYHQSNLGDDLFQGAFRRVLPGADLRFVNELTPDGVGWCDAVVFGGGSFLDSPVSRAPGGLEAAASKVVMYVGVGLETAAHPDHAALLARASLVVARSEGQAGRADMVAPDLAYSLDRGPGGRSRNGVLFIPNASVVPTRSSPQWAHAAWGYFKSEASQFLDELTSGGRRVEMVAMCRSRRVNDEWAAAELVAHTDSRSTPLLPPPCPATAVEFFSRFEAVVTQRYHGAVLSELAGTPCVSVFHHDKLRGVRPGTSTVPYYGVSKSGLHSALLAARPAEFDRAADAAAFSEVGSAVMGALGRSNA